MFTIRTRTQRHVLFAMANPRAANSKAREPGFSEHTCYVHGVIFNRIFSGKEAVYRVQCRLPSGGDTNLL